MLGAGGHIDEGQGSDSEDPLLGGFGAPPMPALTPPPGAGASRPAPPGSVGEGSGDKSCSR